MAFLEVFSSIDLSNPPELTGDLVNPSPTGFDLSSATADIQLTGNGFLYDPDTGEPIAGAVTSIDWVALNLAPINFMLTGLDWDLATHGNIGEGFVVDGTTLTGPTAEWAYWLRGNDEALGSGESDTLLGFAGNDTLRGDGGDDELNGGSGGDALYGGLGNDTLLGGTGGDFLQGGEGDDTIDGGAIQDRVNFSDGNTVSYEDDASGVVVDLSGITGDGSVGQGTATSANGTDVLMNVPFVRGGAGNDSIRGSSAAIFEMIEGGAGDDTLDGGAITNGVTDNNRVSYQTAGAAVSVDLQAGTATGAATGSDVLSNFSQVRGSAHNDTLLGSTSSLTEQFDGRAGNDHIDGRGGFDIVRYDSASAAVTVNLGGSAAGGDGTDTLVGIEGVYGSSHNDTLLGSAAITGLEVFRGGAGNDSISGGAGTDRADYGSSFSGVQVDLAAGRALNDGFGTQDTLVGVENVRGSEFNDSLTGSTGNNVLEGQGGNDSLVGGAGNDTLLGGAGSDRLLGGAGNDSIDGGAILDRLNYTDLNILSFAGDTLGVNVNLSGITGDGTTGQGTVTGRSTLAGNAGSDVVRNVNYIIGGSGADSIVGSSANIIEFFEGGLGNDTISGGAIGDSFASGNRVVYSSSSAGVNVNLQTGVATGAGIGTDTLGNINQVRASNYNDTLVGSNRTDVAEIFEGRFGNDSINGQGGTDFVRYDQANTGWVNVNLQTGTALTAVEGTDTLAGIEGVFGSHYGDTLTGGNTLSGANWFETGKSEIFRGAGGNDLIDGGVGFDQANYASSTSAVLVNLGTGQAYDGLGGVDTLSGIEGVRGSDHDDTIYGSDRATFSTDNYVEYFEAHRGNDSIVGGGGIDQVQYTSSSEGVSVDLLTGRANDGMGGTDTLEGIEFVRGSNYNDTIVGANGFTSLEGMAGNDDITAGTGNDRAYGGDGNDTLRGLDGHDTLDGQNGDDRLYGGAGNDSLVGGAGNDSMLGEAGLDTLVGGGNAGNDTMDGGAITDRINYTDLNYLSYAGETVGVTINLSGITGDGSTGSGTASSTVIGSDTVRNVNFIIGGSGNDSITGSSAMLLEQFEGGAGNDTINGGAITDLLSNVNSNRVAYHNNASAVNVNLTTGVATGAGTDTLININHVRASNHADTLVGSDRTDVTEQFEGRGGNDSIDGRGGFDMARFDSAAVAVNVNLVTGIATGDGTDTLAGIEGIIGSSHDDTLTGGNTLSGASYTDGKLEVFRAGGGDDSIDGGVGVDRVDYTSSTVGVNVDLGAGRAFNDGVFVSGFQGVDTLSGIEGVRGSDFDDTLTGSDGLGGDHFEYFEGRGGDDTIDGMGGTDWVHYTTALAGVNVDLQAGMTTEDGYGNVDTLSNIEAARGSSFNDTMAGTDTGSTLEGLAGNDELTGGLGDDVLSGGAGVDTLAGGLGNDTYVALDFSESIVEDADAGTDTVQLGQATGGVFTLAANVENAVASGTAAINVVGNELANEITGNAANNNLNGGAGNDTLDGGLGSDTLVGGEGDDHYVVNVATDVVSETTVIGAGGSDHVEVNYAGTYTLTANVESAVLNAPGAGSLLGNAIANLLEGNSAANLLSGGAGDDTMDGQSGNDTIDGGLGTDRAVLTGVLDDYTVSRPDAISTVLVGHGMTVTLRGVEQVEFDDGVRSLAEVHGNVATIFSDTLLGSEGNDTFNGLAGNDSLVGNGGNDNLNGGAGIDTLVGGAGDDTFTIETVSDQIVEAVDGGTDTVIFGVPLAGTFTVGANVENGTLTGALLGTNLNGNALNNTLTGNAAANIINGLAGDDRLDGGLGNDTLAGGLGNDTYVINSALDVVSELAGAGAEDEVEIRFTASGTYTLTANVEEAEVYASNSLVINVNGNASNNDIIGHGGNNSLTGGAGDDILEGDGGRDTLDGGLGTDEAILAGARGDYTIERLSLTDTRFTHTNGSAVTMRGIESVYFYGAGYDDELDDEDVSMTTILSRLGSPFNDSLVGASGSETLSGGAGNDTLRGNDGSDVLAGGAGGDTYQFGMGDGDHVIRETDATALVIDTLLIDADSGSVAGGEVRISRDTGDVDDVLVSITSGDAGEVTETIRIDEFFLNDAINPAGAIEQIRFLDGNVTLGTAQILSELLKGTGSGDSILGFAGNDSINGLEGNDSLLGQAGNDTLVGNLGDDALFGGAGADVLQGNLGMDTLTGGIGNDTLTGGAQADRFVLDTQNGTDRITDFQSGVDTIAISQAAFSAMTGTETGTPVTLDELGTAFAYDGTTGALTYDADGAGAGAAVVVAQLNAGTTLAADFLIIG